MRHVGHLYPGVVDLARVEDALRDDLHVVLCNAAEETARVALVTGRTTDLPDLEKQGVGVTIP